MARGGIYDQVGGGFARYSVDATWTVPHFEKMLYDNALLARAYLHGWQVSGEERFRAVCCETLDWALREMRGPEGGFCSALDADSEGVEGKFYVWTPEELRDALGAGARPSHAIAYFGAARAGQLRARGRRFSRPAVPMPERAPRDPLRGCSDRASERVRPGLDDKRLTSWNALMISALAEAGRGAGAHGLRRGRGRLRVVPARRCARRRRAAAAHAGRTAPRGSTPTSRTTRTCSRRCSRSTRRRSTRAGTTPRSQLGDTLIEHFSDPERGGFFTTADDGESLPARRKDLEDTPIPSSNSAAAFGLLRLALLSGEGKYERHALGVLRLLYPMALSATRLRSGTCCALRTSTSRGCARSRSSGRPRRPTQLVSVVREQLRPHLVLASAAVGTDGVPLLEDREPIDGHAAAYVCEHFVCQAPVSEPDGLRAALAGSPSHP